MSIPRIFHHAELQISQQIILEPNAANHVAKVLRLTTGDPLIIFNGKGGEFLAVVTEISKKSVNINVTHFHDTNRESPLTIHLGQVISRGEKMDFTIQKAVELGVSKITPLTSERCNVKLDQARSERRHRHWQGIVINACEQSGRTKIPPLDTTTTLENWLASPFTGTSLLLSPTAEIGLTMSTKPTQLIRILIGPEGGFTPIEITHAQQQKFIPIALGPRILRTETAALTMISILQYLAGDFAPNS